MKIAIETQSLGRKFRHNRLIIAWEGVRETLR
jgi:hypothetical protein